MIIEPIILLKRDNNRTEGKKILIGGPEKGGGIGRTSIIIYFFKIKGEWNS